MKLANIIEKPLPATAGYKSDTKHFGAPEPGGPQNSGGHQVGPDGVWRGLEVPGDEPHPIKTANDPIQARRVVRGLKLAIEWPKGTERKYMDKKDPTKVNYKKLMKADYGYIPGTKDADGEQLDVYVGPDLKSDKVFVIRQLKDDGSFDENKVMLGYDTWESAKKGFLAHMPRKRLGRVTQMSTEHFKKRPPPGLRRRPSARQGRRGAPRRSTWKHWTPRSSSSSPSAVEESAEAFPDGGGLPRLRPVHRGRRGRRLCLDERLERREPLLTVTHCARSLTSSSSAS